MYNIELTVDEEAPIELEYIEAKMKPEQVKQVTPGWEGFSVTPDEGCVLSRVDIAGMPEPTDVEEITENGDHNVARKGIARVQVPIPPGYIIPSGLQTFTRDGTYNVAQLETAVVQTSPTNVAVLEDFDESGNPTTLRLVGITKIPKSLWSRYVSDNSTIMTKIKRIVMDDSLTKIGSTAFERSYIEEFDFPASITEWGEYIVRNCSRLTKCTFRGDVDLNYYFFNGTILEEVHFFGNITFWQSPNFPNSMRLYDFSGCTEIPALGNVSWIGYGAGTVIQVPSAKLDEWKAKTNWCDLPTDTSLERYVIWEGV